MTHPTDELEALRNRIAVLERELRTERARFAEFHRKRRVEAEWERLKAELPQNPIKIGRFS